MPERTNLDDLEQTPHAEVFPQQSPRTVRLQLAAEERVPPHQHPGTTIVLHVLDGRLELTLDGESHVLRPDDVVRFTGDQDISPRAIEESTALLVFAPEA